MKTYRKAVQQRFVESVRLGVKRTTIRPVPKRKRDIPQEGDTIVLYRWTGKPYRSKQEVIGRYRVACDAWEVTVKSDRVVYHNIFGDGEDQAMLDNAERGDLTMVAHREGFKGWPEMLEWFKTAHVIPFTGIMIEWEGLP